MKIIQSKIVPTHILSGFLGAGKTTLLQHLLQQKPEHEVWAILMNEFGQIGIDQQLLPQQQGFEIKELLGGCMCCSSQLPLHIALARLLTDAQPNRLFIEPTGLGHPAQLMEQLTEPHWQSSLDMRALVTVVDGSRLHDRAWVKHNLYEDQIKAAEIIVISHTDIMTFEDDLALEQLQQEYAVYQQQWLKTAHGELDLKQIDQPHRTIERKIQPLLIQQRQQSIQEAVTEIKQLPYHYVEHAQGYLVAGWKFPRRWVFDFDQLLDVLCAQKDWLRLKAIFHTHQGWMYFNCNPEQFNYKSGEENIDNRIEMISQHEHNWLKLETDLLACRLET
ncbi:CobW family GTP-binding protein [Acinetobacter ihumii]|uniref:CobW family GTP-binding protein n=1 Tax=Acinetobacter ihumii TaxID=2483802 RepID=UPI001031E238|nr:GTP-binding protein [Acinetobacter ihumii]